MPNQNERSTKSSRPSRKQLIRIGFWALLILAAILIVRAIVDNGGEDSSSTPRAAEIVTVDELREFASSQDRPIYWAGIQTGAELELSEPEAGQTHVRYLTDGAEAGAPSSEFLDVGSYAFPDAAAALTEQSQQPGGIRATAPGGGVIYFNRSSPQNVYLAYPGEDVQIEVYDPEAKRALSLVTSGLIVPIG